MRIFKGMFLLKKEKDYAVGEIKRLCNKYNDKQTSDTKAEKCLYQSYFRDVEECLKDCFCESFGSIRRCLSFVRYAQSCDDINYKRIARCKIFFFLMELYQLVPDAISISDFPSCKDLLKLSGDDLVSAANDLVGTKVVKGQVSLVLLGKGVENIIKVGDVMAYYDNMITEMQSDINEKGLSNILLESFLLQKAKAEYAYCFLAMLKIEHGIVKETKSVHDAQKDIEQYENMCQQNNIGGLSISNNV